jgi:uncharacterized membrane protein
MAFAFPPLFRSSRFRIAAILVLTGVVVFAIVSATRGLVSKPQNSSVEEEIRVTVEAVGKLMELPAEKPTVATVSDVTKLPIATQPFFTAAKNGDKVLFYNDAKKAILYRPQTNKIVNVAPIIVNPNVK